MRFLACLSLAVALVVLAFHYAKPLPSKAFDESFLPKASVVRYLVAGHNETAAGLFWIQALTNLGEKVLEGNSYDYLSHVADVSTQLDSTFYTPYLFVGSITNRESLDTTDLGVMRRGVRNNPDDWRLSLYFAMRLAYGPFKLKKEAADVMRPFFSSPDTTIPPHVRMMYRTFELDTMQVETALFTAVDDIMQPQFKAFRSSYYNKIYRILGYAKDKSAKKDEILEKIEKLVDDLSDGKAHPLYVYNQLLQMKKAPEVSEASVAESSDSLAVEKAEN